jgi:gluconolactonase
MLIAVTELIAPGATLEQLHTGSEWTEGPLWLPDTRSVRWSDIPNDRILEFDSQSGQTRVHRVGVEFTNGRTLDRSGAVVQCCHGRRTIEREIDGRPVTLAGGWEGGRFNSPNDIVVAADGTIWFTDPPYGILSDHEGHAAPQEYDGCFVFRFDEVTGEVRPVVTDMVHPNGLAFSPDESLLYVSDTAEAEHWIRVYDVVDGECRNGRLFAVIEPPAPDGFRVDELGRIWTSSGDSVQVLDPDGTVVGRIPVPERVSNVCFGGEDGRDLYITATSSLYRIRVTVRSARRPAA